MLYLYPHIEQGDGNGGCGQFLMLPLPLLYPQGEDFSHSSSAPSCGSSHGRQFTTSYNTTPSHRIRFFISCSSLGPFHGVQLLRIRLLQHGSSMESGPASTPAPAWTPQVLPGAWSNAGFPVGHSILHASTCSRIYQGCRWITAPPWTFHGQQGDSLPYCGLLHQLQRSLCSGTGTPPPPASPLTWVPSCVAHILTVLYPVWNCSCALTSFLFLNLLSQRHYHHQWCSALAKACPSWSIWHWAWEKGGNLLAASHLSSPAIKNLTTQTQYTHTHMCVLHAYSGLNH